MLTKPSTLGQINVNKNSPCGETKFVSETYSTVVKDVNAMRDSDCITYMRKVLGNKSTVACFCRLFFL